MFLLRQIVLVVLAAVTSIYLTGSSLAKDKEDLTIYTIKKNYKKSKYEPDKGVYLCAYVLQDVTIDYSMKKLNAVTGKKHASYFRYVGYNEQFPTKWVEDVKSVGAVPHIAWEPNNGLEEVQDNEHLRNFARAAKKADVPIFLRYASEMNGDWTQYSGKSKLYIEKWKMVHDVMEQEAPNVMMVWAVFTFPDHTIDDFYPGDDYVDWVGVNIYNVMYHNNNIKNRADHEDPLKLLNFVYNQYSYKKPIQISEFGVSHFSTTDNKYYIDFAKEKLTRFYGNVPKKYPRVKSIFYFDVNNIVNAPTGRRINDYSLTSDKEVLKTYSNLVKSEEYLTEVVKENPAPSDELLSYRGFSFDRNGRTYTDIEFFQNYLGLSVKVNGDKVTLSDQTKSIEFKITKGTVSKGYARSVWRIKGLPLRDVASKFGYTVQYNSKDHSVFIYK